MLLAAAVAAKLVIVPPGQAAAVIDYPSMGRCERAKAEMDRQTEAGVEATRRSTAGLNQPVIITRTVTYCIPG